MDIDNLGGYRVLFQSRKYFLPTSINNFLPNMTGLITIEIVSLKMYTTCIDAFLSRCVTLTDVFFFYNSCYCVH